MTANQTLEYIMSETKKYNFGKIELITRGIRGRKLAYSQPYSQQWAKGDKVSGRIVLDQRFVEYAQNGHQSELVDVISHELAHLVAECHNKTKKHVWHGQAWQAAHKALGGNGNRYYSGSFVKPENEGKTFTSMAELRQTVPVQPATDWQHGTYRQWLARGYHVNKGEKGKKASWIFKAEPYESANGKEETGWARASAVYFGPRQVAANQPKKN
jgi:hypothetical protein